MFRQIVDHDRAREDAEYVAHVVDGNSGPVHALLRSGFRSAGETIVRVRDVDETMHIEHMMEQGAPGVLMHTYVFAPSSLERLALDLYAFARDNGGVLHAPGLDVHVDLSLIVDPGVLDARVQTIDQRRGR